jgi:hypothetical protein
VGGTATILVRHLIPVSSKSYVLELGYPPSPQLSAIRGSTGTRTFPVPFTTETIPSIIAFSNQVYASAARSAPHSTTTFVVADEYRHGDRTLASSLPQESKRQLQAVGPGALDR